MNKNKVMVRRSLAGIIFIKVDSGKEKTILDKVCSINNIEKVYRTFGDYEIIAITKDIGLEDLRKTVEEIRRMEGVLSTTTMIIVEKYIRHEKKP